MCKIWKAEEKKQAFLYAMKFGGGPGGTSYPPDLSAGLVVGEAAWLPWVPAGEYVAR